MIDLFDGFGLPDNVRQMPDLEFHSRKDKHVVRRAFRFKRFSANLVVDLANATEYFGSLRVLSGDSTVVGGIVDLLNGNTFCNVVVQGYGSGPLPLFIQTADATTSGSFTDPTSGLPADVFTQFGNRIASGGIFWANSGLPGSGNFSPAAPVGSAPAFCSGGVAFAAFQRPHRYARLVCTSGNASLTSVPFFAGFVTQKKTTGSGGGFSYQPGSGSINV